MALLLTESICLIINHNYARVFAVLVMTLLQNRRVPYDGQQTTSYIKANTNSINNISGAAMPNTNTTLTLSHPVINRFELICNSQLLAITFSLKKY